MQTNLLPTGFKKLQALIQEKVRREKVSSLAGRKLPFSDHQNMNKLCAQHFAEILLKKKKTTKTNLRANKPEVLFRVFRNVMLTEFCK